MDRYKAAVMESHSQPRRLYTPVAKLLSHLPPQVKLRTHHNKENQHLKTQRFLGEALPDSLSELIRARQNVSIHDLRGIYQRRKSPSSIDQEIDRLGRLQNRNYRLRVDLTQLQESVLKGRMNALSQELLLRELLPKLK